MDFVPVENPQDKAPQSRGASPVILLNEYGLHLLLPARFTPLLLTYAPEALGESLELALGLAGSGTGGRKIP